MMVMGDFQQQRNQKRQHIKERKPLILHEKHSIDLRSNQTTCFTGVSVAFDYCCEEKSKNKADIANATSDLIQNDDDAVNSENLPAITPEEIMKKANNKYSPLIDAGQPFKTEQEQMITRFATEYCSIEIMYRKHYHIDPSIPPCIGRGVGGRYLTKIRRLPQIKQQQRHPDQNNVVQREELLDVDDGNKQDDNYRQTKGHQTQKTTTKSKIRRRSRTNSATVPQLKMKASCITSVEKDFPYTDEENSEELFCTAHNVLKIKNSYDNSSSGNKRIVNDVLWEVFSLQQNKNEPISAVAAIPGAPLNTECNSQSLLDDSVNSSIIPKKNNSSMVNATTLSASSSSRNIRHHRRESSMSTTTAAIEASAGGVTSNNSFGGGAIGTGLDGTAPAGVSGSTVKSAASYLAVRSTLLPISLTIEEETTAGASLLNSSSSVKEQQKQTQIDEQIIPLLHRPIALHIAELNFYKCNNNDNNVTEIVVKPLVLVSSSPSAVDQGNNNSFLQLFYCPIHQTHQSLKSYNENLMVEATSHKHDGGNDGKNTNNQINNNNNNNSCRTRQHQHTNSVKYSSCGDNSHIYEELLSCIHNMFLHSSSSCASNPIMSFSSFYDPHPQNIHYLAMSHQDGTIRILTYVVHTVADAMAEVTDTDTAMMKMQSINVTSRSTTNSKKVIGSPSYKNSSILRMLDTSEFLIDGPIVSLHFRRAGSTLHLIVGSLFGYACLFSKAIKDENNSNTQNTNGSKSKFHGPFPIVEDLWDIQMIQQTLVSPVTNNNSASSNAPNTTRQPSYINDDCSYASNNNSNHSRNRNRSNSQTQNTATIDDCYKPFAVSEFDPEDGVLVVTTLPHGFQSSSSDYTPNHKAKDDKNVNNLLCPSCSKRYDEEDNGCFIVAVGTYSGRVLLFEHETHRVHDQSCTSQKSCDCNHSINKNKISRKSNCNNCITSKLNIQHIPIPEHKEGLEQQKTQKLKQPILQELSKKEQQVLVSTEITTIMDNTNNSNNGTVVMLGKEQKEKFTNEKQEKNVPEVHFPGVIPCTFVTNCDAINSSGLRPEQEWQLHSQQQQQLQVEEQEQLLLDQDNNKSPSNKNNKFQNSAMHPGCSSNGSRVCGYGGSNSSSKSNVVDDDHHNNKSFRLIWDQSFSHPIHGITSADINGDGIPELIITTQVSLHILEQEQPWQRYRDKEVNETEINTLDVELLADRVHHKLEWLLQ